MSLTKKRTLLTIGAAAFLFLSLVMTALRMVAIYTAVDPATGFYSADILWYDVLLTVFAAFGILFFGFSYLFGVRFCTKTETKERNLTPMDSQMRPTCGTRLMYATDSTPRIFASAFCGFSLITFALLSFIELALTPMEIALQVLAILAGIYLLLQYTPLFPLYSARRTLGALLPVIWSGATLVQYFLTSNRIATGEYHNWYILSLVTITVFFFLQSLFTTPARVLYRFHTLYAVGILGAGLTLIFTVPTLLLSSFWCYSAYMQYTNFYALMGLIACAVYMTIFLFGFLHDLGKVKNQNGLYDICEDETSL
ncbi:MAG: hypothetical protein IKT43_04635 [Clostridia bacterium]|nr:hypothetical protein [Clostridia bacterium]